MNLEPRAPAVAESYPTFWDEIPTTPAPATPAAPDEDAYTSFVNFTETELPADTPPDAE